MAEHPSPASLIPPSRRAPLHFGIHRHLTPSARCLRVTRRQETSECVRDVRAGGPREPRGECPRYLSAPHVGLLRVAARRGAIAPSLAGPRALRGQCGVRACASGVAIPTMASLVQAGGRALARPRLPLRSLFQGWKGDGMLPSRWMSARIISPRGELVTAAYPGSGRQRPRTPSRGGAPRGRAQPRSCTSG